MEVLLVAVLVIVGSLGISFAVALGRVLWTAVTAPTFVENRTLLVPGKKLEGNLPDQDFRFRLDRAAALASNSLSTVILGAATADAQVSEASAGLGYLRAQYPNYSGHIDLEQASTTTFENFRNAREMLGGDRACAVISNRYHLARCLSLARSVGVNVVPVAAEAKIRLPLMAWLREAWFMHLFDVGKCWAQLRRHRELLAYLR